MDAALLFAALVSVAALNAAVRHHFFDPDEGMSFDLADLRFDRTVRELHTLENLLWTVRKTGERVKWQGLLPEWQAAAMNTSKFELEWLIVAEVWASRGDEFRAFRLRLSPFRREIIQVEKQLQNQIQAA